MIDEILKKGRHSVWCLGIGLAVVSCSSPKPTGPPTVETFQQEGGSAGYGGQTLMNQVTTTNTVVSIDSAQRKIVMRQPNGNVVTYRAGPEIANFADFKVGDPVKATVIDQMAVSVLGTGALPATNSGPVMIRVKKGTTFTSLPVTTTQFTAKVVALDSMQGFITLQMADGQTRTISPPPGVDLPALNVGDDVAVTATEAMAIELEKPY